ncbi:AAA family ATPase [Ferroplasma sp.]|uniref:ATP-binding protein n=1 Tax=Ferroplasma sp. TaxID=2591003 RepID=UPI0026325D77|nr:AAA family ATPase [Ferroplasma sp.]
MRTIVEEQKNQILVAENIIKREALSKISINLPYAIKISGIRRAGNSTLLQQLFQKFPDFYYFNFEYTRLIDFEAIDFEKLDQVLLEEYGPSKLYIFDEILNIKSWEIFVRSRLDNGKQFFITRSNACMLSRELGTRLTGRHISVELFPFSYHEELQFYNKGSSIEAFDEYFTDGGFPEYLKYKQPAILQELLMDIIYRDIVIRHSIRNAKSLHEMAIYLLANTGKDFPITD